MFDSNIIYIFRLHYKVTTGLLLACSLLVTAVQLVTDPITCDVKVDIENSEACVQTMRMMLMMIMF